MSISEIEDVAVIPPAGARESTPRAKERRAAEPVQCTLAPNGVHANRELDSRIGGRPHAAARLAPPARGGARAGTGPAPRLTKTESDLLKLYCLLYVQYTCVERITGPHECSPVHTTHYHCHCHCHWNTDTHGGTATGTRAAVAAPGTHCDARARTVAIVSTQQR